MSMDWDGTGKRFYENGVDHGILFVRNDDGSYGNGIAWNGLTTVSESPEGAEANDLWADNIKYATLYSNETFSATIEAYMYPDEFAQCDGSYQPVEGVNFGQQARRPFAFCYRTHVGNDAGLDAYKLHIVYNCQASPSEKSYETINDSPDAITFSWEISTTPTPHGNIRPVSTIIIDSSKLDSRGLEIMHAIENMIYGDDENNSQLPSTDYIAEQFGTYSGNPVTFEATKSTPISKLKVYVEPIQSGSGDPSSENVREISGHTSVTVTLSSTDDPSEGTDYTINVPSTPGTVYGGTVDPINGELIVTKGYIASYNGEELSGKWISSMDVYSESDSPTTGAQVVYDLDEPVTYALTGQQIAIPSVVGANYVSTTEPNTVELVYREDAGAADSSGYTKTQLLNLADPNYVKNLVKIGMADKVFEIGDQFNATWNDGTTSYECPFDVVHFGKVYDEYGCEKYAMFLQAHYGIPATQFDASEAIYYCEEALAAGTYYFTIGDTWGTGFTKDDVFSFTLTQGVPAGGQIVIGNGTSKTNWGGNSATYTTWKVYTYSSKSETTSIEDPVSVSSGAPVSSGIDLGTISITTKDGSTGLNNLERASGGYDRWAQSGIRQWLNSNAEAGAWWTAQNNYDRPPEELSTKRGFKAGFSQSFINMLSPMKVTTIPNSVSDADITNYDTVTDTFALASLEQEYCAPSIAEVEGEAFTYWVNTLELDEPQAAGNGGANTNHIRYLISNHSSAQDIKVRSVFRSSSHTIRNISSAGVINSKNANGSCVVCPYCVVC